MQTTIKSKGFGDTVEKFTTMTGIKAVTKVIAPSCNCDARREKLNTMFPYKK